MNDQSQPHCADHVSFHAECETCNRARANFQPYPVRLDKPVTRTFGFDDDLTEEKLRALDPRAANFFKDEKDFSLSLTLLRIVRRLIWPF